MKILQSLQEINKRYPCGTEVILKNDNPGEVHIVASYHPLYDHWYLDFIDGTMVCVDRLEDLETKEKVR